MKFAISGAGGFLGRALCKRLLNIGESVRMIPQDMLESEYSLKSYLESEKPDYIIHLAAYGNYHNQRDLRKIYTSNLDYLINLLEASKEVKYKQFINFSTSSVVGKQKEPVGFLSVPHPNTYYASSKLAGEHLCRVFAETHKKSIATIRPFSITGVGEQESHLIPTLIRNGLSGDRVQLDPNPTHDFVDVDDIINLIFKLVKVTGPYQLLYAGSGVMKTNLEVLKIVEKVIKKKIKYEEVGKMRSYDFDNWVLDKYLVHMLNFSYAWEPKKTLEDSIKEMYESITQEDT